VSQQTKILLVVVLAAVLFATPVVHRVQTRAKRMNTVTDAPAGADGVVRADPATLAHQAGVTLDTYALARMVASEHPRDSRAIRVAVAWAARNYAAKGRVSVSRLLLRAVKNGKVLAHDGLFARQNTGGKYATTANDPNADDLEVASLVISGRVADPTGGADQFDSPAAQRAAVARGAKNYTKTPEEVAADRRRSGKVLVTLAGVPADKVRFWRNA